MIEISNENNLKIAIMRDKMLASWAAELMRMGESDCKRYIGEVIDADFMNRDYEALIRKLYNDLKATGIVISAREILKKFEEFEKIATNSVLN